MEECDMIAVNLIDLGAYCKAAGSIAKAQDAYNDSIRILRRLENHDQEIVHALLGLADLMIVTGEHEAALNYYNECLDIQKTLFSETHEDVATTLYLIGVLTTSNAFLAESVDMIVALKGENHPFIGDAYNMMGFVEMKNGNADVALEKFSDALRVRRATRDRLKEAETLKNVGNVYRERNELKLALEQYEECLGIITEAKGRDSEAVVDVLIAMGSIMSDMNLHEGAMSHFKNGEQIVSLLAMT
jgi:tetratricopeptide (TPR) repeat protein